jgi:hypothetical protein
MDKCHNKNLNNITLNLHKKYTFLNSLYNFYNSHYKLHTILKLPQKNQKNTESNINYSPAVPLNHLYKSKHKFLNLHQNNIHLHKKDNLLPLRLYKINSDQHKPHIFSKEKNYLFNFLKKKIGLSKKKFFN